VVHPGSGVRFFEIGRDQAGFKNETPSGQFRKTEHLTPVSGEGTAFFAAGGPVSGGRAFGESLGLDSRGAHPTA
jgi:hypothetical protein